MTTTPLSLSLPTEFEAAREIAVLDVTQPSKIETRKPKFDALKSTGEPPSLPSRNRVATMSQNAYLEWGQRPAVGNESPTLNFFLPTLPRSSAAERVGIYVACNTAAHLAFNGAAGAPPALAALAALRATAPTSVAYGVAMQAAASCASLPAAPSVLLATALAPAAVAACCAPPAASAAALAARAAVFARAAARNLPVGAAWAAEWAAYAATRDALGVRVSKTERNKNRRSSDPSTRFAIGAASIGAVCAAMAPFRAVPWISAQVATRMIRSKVWWYGSYEALKAATNSQATSEIPHPGVLEERERRVVSAGDAMRRARAVARATATRPKKLREIPRIKRGALKPPGGSVHLNAIHARGFVL